jgi:uncharacterized surface protein with fasciclin (FAS1) repeats
MQKKFDIVDTALAAGNFSTLAAALGAAGLIETLKGEGPFTVFAPTDDAFGEIPAETLSQLLQPANRDKLTAILTYHVLPGRVTSHEAINLADGSAQTIQGQSVTLKSNHGLMINDARVIVPDVEATNGVIHVIDKVLTPATAATA